MCVAPGTASQVRSELGMEGDAELGTVQGSPVRLQGKIAWAHEWQTATTATAWFQALPGANFTVFGAPLPSDIAVLRLFSEAELDRGWSLRLSEASVTDSVLLLLLISVRRCHLKSHASYRHPPLVLLSSTADCENCGRDGCDCSGRGRGARGDAKGDRLAGPEAEARPCLDLRDRPDGVARRTALGRVSPVAGSVGRRRADRQRARRGDAEHAQGTPAQYPAVPESADEGTHRDLEHRPRRAAAGDRAGCRRPAQLVVAGPRIRQWRGGRRPTRYP